MPAKTHLADHVVIAVFDGLRADMVRPDLTPNILRLAGRGTWFREARSVFPSVTRVATTSVATGAPPSVHGIVGNAFYHAEVLPDRVFDTSKAADIALAQTFHDGRFVTADSFGDQLARSGRKLAVVHTGSAGSAHLVSPRAKANGHWTFSVHGVDHTQTPEAVIEVVSRLGPFPERELPRHRRSCEYGGRLMTEHVLPAGARCGADLVQRAGYDLPLQGPSVSAEAKAVHCRRRTAAFGTNPRLGRGPAPMPSASAVIAASDHGQISTSGSIEPLLPMRARQPPASA